MEFNFVHLRFHITTNDAARLVSFLYGSGSAFAAAFRRTVCRKGSVDCSACRELPDCPYQRLFGQHLATDPVAVRRYQKPPLPFIFSFPFPAEAMPPVCDLSCELVLVGNAIQHIADCIAALHTLLGASHGTAWNGSAHITVIESLDYQGNAVVVATATGAVDLARIITLDAAGVAQGRIYPGNDMIGLRFLTPLRLMKDGQPLKSFDPSQFFRSLMRRVSSLAYYYCGLEMDDNFQACSAAADRLHLLEDQFFFGRHDRSKNLSGVMGEGCLSGDFRDMMTFLILGEYLHLGKGASYGMGKYELF